MQIYRWGASRKAPEYIGATEKAQKAIVWEDKLIGEQLPSLDEWRPPVLTQYLGDKGERIPRTLTDCVSSASVNFISERAVSAMSDIWDRHATLYPVQLDDTDRPYFMVVAATELDCLIRESSTGPLQKYGPTPELFASLYTWAFHEESIGNADLFVNPDSRTHIFVSERFKERVIDEGLSGFMLRAEFWEEDPWQS